MKLNAELVATVPGAEAEALNGTADADTIVLIGDRAAVVPGLLNAAADFADRTGARLGWVPRRAGDAAARSETGCLPNLLPGGRPTGDVLARVDVQAAWGVDSLPGTPGLDADEQLAAAREGFALLVGGLGPSDFRAGRRGARGA